MKFKGICSELFMNLSHYKFVLLANIKKKMTKYQICHKFVSGRLFAIVFALRWFLLKAWLCQKICIYVHSLGIFLISFCKVLYQNSIDVKLNE